MRVLGVDPASGKAGAALVVDGKPVWARSWRNRPQSRRGYPRIEAYMDWLDECAVDAAPDLAIIEFASNVQAGRGRGSSIGTVRVLGHFESASYIVCGRHGIDYLSEVTATTARSYVVGSRSKEQAYDFVTQMFPELGDIDDNQADAVVLALDAPRAMLAI